MNKELYKELREIECKLYDILEADGGVLDHKLVVSQSTIYSYLEEVKNNLEDQAKAQYLKKGRL